MIALATDQQNTDAYLGLKRRGKQSERFVALGERRGE